MNIKEKEAGFKPGKDKIMVTWKWLSKELINDEINTTEEHTEGNNKENLQTITNEEKQYQN